MLVLVVPGTSWWRPRLPRREAQPYDGSFQAGYGHHGSLADLFRQVGHDERVHKLESLAALDEPRLRDDRPAVLKARSQRGPITGSSRSAGDGRAAAGRRSCHERSRRRALVLAAC